MRTHRFAPTSLLFGLLFAGFGLAFLRGDPNVWQLNWSWIWPAALVAAGLAVLASARPRRPELDAPDEQMAPPQPDDEPLDGPVL